MGNGAFAAQLDRAGAATKELGTGVERRMGVRLAVRRVEDGLFVAAEAVATLPATASADGIDARDDTRAYASWIPPGLVGR